MKHITSNHVSSFCVLAFILIISSCSDNSTSSESENEPVPKPEVNLLQAFPGQSGEIVDITVDGITISVEKINGVYVYQSDIIIEPDDLDEGSTQKNYNKTTLNYGFRTWSTNRIPYVFDNNLSESHKQDILDGIQILNDSTNINIVPRGQDENSFYIEFISSDGNAATKGRHKQSWRKKHKIKLKPVDRNKFQNYRARNAGNAMHEIMHTLGIPHEQSRFDREKYVIVHYDRILDGKEDQFDLMETFQPKASYDLFSIMHYGPYDWQLEELSELLELNKDCSNWDDCPTMTDSDGFTWTQNHTQLKESDIQKINELYPEDTFKECGDIIADVEGNEYETVQIGEQCWMAENLNSSRYQDGTEIPNVTDDNEWSNLTTGAWAYYDNDSDLGDIYGKLYNWHAVDDNRKICPSDWKVPSDKEWKTLEIHLGMPSSEADEIANRGWEANIGGMMKAKRLWNSPNEGATNESGFNGLPGGNRDANPGAFYSVRIFGFWWTSTLRNVNESAWWRALSYHDNSVWRTPEDEKNINVGFSVRCLMK